VNRRDLVNAVAAETGVDSKQVDAVIKGFTDVVTATVSGGEVVAITGFAKFAKVERAARMGRNPATGEAIKIKASKKARITPLKAFKDAVLAGKRAPAKKTAPAKKAAPARKAAPAKKAPAKKAAVKKAPARKAPARKAPARKR
jgi:DNA-binding protein HU-beta